MMKNMNKPHLLSKSRGTRNLFLRIITILTRFGITAKGFQHKLKRYSVVTSSLGCTPTFAITAVILKRHAGIIRELHKQGVEFAVHGYIHTDYRLISLEQQTQHFNKAIKIFESSQIPFTGFRAPFLRINGKTPQVLGNLGFKYDSSHSLNWDVIDPAKYSKQSWHEYNRLLDYYVPLNSEEYLSLPRFINGFVEIPVSLPDDEAMVDRLGLKDEKEISRLWLDILQRTYNRGELFTVQLHPERITLCENALIDIIQQSKQHNPPIWVPTLQEIAEWWREKDRFALEVEAKGSGRYRVTADCTDRAMLLVKKCSTNAPLTEWAYGYQSTTAREFVIESPVRPVIGIGPDSSDTAVKFLKSEGYPVEESEQPENYGIYLGDLAQFTEADEKPLSTRIEQSNAPLLRYWRWPYDYKSAMSITGDIDSITLQDFVLRILENWRQTLR